MSKGLAAGPFNDPNRFEGGSEAVMDKEKKEPVKGAFERPLNIYRCAYAYVNQARSNLPNAIGGISWIGLDRPANAALLPFYCGALDLPVSLQRTDPLVYDENSLWMAFNYVGNYAMLRYSYIINDITLLRKKLEADAFGRQKELETQARELWKMGNRKAARALLTETCNDHAETVRKAWWSLSHALYIKYYGEQKVFNFLSPRYGTRPARGGAWRQLPPERAVMCFALRVIQRRLHQHARSHCTETILPSLVVARCGLRKRSVAVSKIAARKIVNLDTWCPAVRTAMPCSLSV